MVTAKPPWRIQPMAMVEYMGVCDSPHHKTRMTPGDVFSDKGVEPMVTGKAKNQTRKPGLTKATFCAAALATSLFLLLVFVLCSSGIGSPRLAQEYRENVREAACGHGACLLSVHAFADLAGILRMADGRLWLCAANELSDVGV